MNNFFLDASDYELFRRALHETKNEPVVINIYSSDGSLQENENKDKAPVQRKNMSNKFEPSAFGKFFGPRKQRTTPVDMKDFSSWKNKNYRKTEQKINENKEDAPVKFSLADFMAEKAKAGKYNELDQAKNDIQKPINQLSTDDPLYKRFSLDSYMHKLEEQTKVKNKFEENDDILEPLGDIQTAKVVPDSSQDENFGTSSELDIEKLAMDDPISGDKFSFEKEELDKVKSRLEKIEREASHIKEKPTEKVISGNELSDIAKEEDNFDFSKLGIEEDEDFEVDDIEKLNNKLSEPTQSVVDENNENDKSPKVDHKRYFEINKNENVKRRVPKSSVVTESISSDSSDLNDAEIEDEEFNIFDSTEDDDKTFEEKIDAVETEEELNDVDEDVLDDENEASDIDSETLDENEELETLMDNLQEDEEEFESEDLAQAVEEPVEEMPQTIAPYGYSEQMQGYVPAGQPVGYVNDTSREDVLTKSDFRTMTDEFINKFSQMYKKEEIETDANAEAEEKIRLEQEELLRATREQQDKLQARIDELTEKNKLAGSEAELKIKQAELEKERVAKEYESKIKELEESYQKNYEAFKKQAYLEKMDNDLKLKKAQSDFKRREIKIKEHEKALSRKNKDVALLRKELKSNLNISKLESDKKLLELTSKENKKKEASTKKVEEVKEEIKQEVEEVVKTEKKTTSSRPKRKTTTTRTKKKPRRKIDSDIIGGIDFE